MNKKSFFFPFSIVKAPLENTFLVETCYVQSSNREVSFIAYHLSFSQQYNVHAQTHDRIFNTMKKKWVKKNTSSSQDYFSDTHDRFIFQYLHRNHHFRQQKKKKRNYFFPPKKKKEKTIITLRLSFFLPVLYNFEV